MQVLFLLPDVLLTIEIKPAQKNFYNTINNTSVLQDPVYAPSEILISFPSLADKFAHHQISETLSDLSCFETSQIQMI